MTTLNTSDVAIVNEPMNVENRSTCSVVSVSVVKMTAIAYMPFT